METKICKKCGETREFSHFYVSDNSCKICRRVLTKINTIRRKLEPDWAEKEKTRHREKYHRLAYKDVHKPSKEDKRVTMTGYINKYPEKRKAKNISQRVFVEKGLERHHWSYNEKDYKDILPMTTKEHNKLHRFLTYDEALFFYRCSVNTKSFNKGDLLDTKEKHWEFYIQIKDI